MNNPGLTNKINTYLLKQVWRMKMSFLVLLLCLSAFWSTSVVTVLKIINAFCESSKINWKLLIYSFIEQKYTEPLIYVRNSVECWGYSPGKTPGVLALTEPPVIEKHDKGHTSIHSTSICWAATVPDAALGLEDPVVEQDRQHAALKDFTFQWKSLVYFRVLWGMKESFLEELVSKLRPEKWEVK